MNKTTANLIKIESTTTTENFAGDTAGPSIIATASGSADKGETAQVYASDGLISNPASGTIGLRIHKGSLDIVVGTMNYQIPIPENPGEKLLYSTDAEGVVKCKIFMDAEGNFIFNDGEDFAVRYSELETAFNQLKSDFDTLVSNYNTTVTTFNAHVHVVTTPDTINGTASPTLTPGANGSTSTADITPAKIEEIKVP